MMVRGGRAGRGIGFVDGREQQQNSSVARSGRV